MDWYKISCKVHPSIHSKTYHPHHNRHSLSQTSLRPCASLHLKSVCYQLSGHGRQLLLSRTNISADLQCLELPPPVDVPQLLPLELAVAIAEVGVKALDHPLHTVLGRLVQPGPVDHLTHTQPAATHPAWDETLQGRSPLHLPLAVPLLAAPAAHHLLIARHLQRRRTLNKHIHGLVDAPAEERRVVDGAGRLLECRWVDEEGGHPPGDG
mmetsp:Transcript_35476/g.101946  ORF Transcript_35476/g.101946 Transcript_35476/m.101946 type:complete len:210 (+) Transcript_35476:62-691(+)